MISADRLTRHFGELVAVDQLNLNVAEGEVFGFLGPNGAGKTTTVRMLAGLISPTSGGAVVGGIDVAAHPAAVRERVGILTETPGLYERLSAWRNLEVFAILYGVRDVPGQVEKYLRMLGLWERRRDPAGSFSKGMRQKLAICRALLHEPPLVFLDEPTSALDPQSSQTVRNFIMELRKDGRTIFLCTHNLHEADRICDKIAIFRSKIVAHGSPDELRAQMYGRKLVVDLVRTDDRILEVIRAVGFEPEIQGGCIEVEISDPRVDSPRIVRALIEAGADVVSVGEMEHSLEQVYMALIGTAE